MRESVELKSARYLVEGRLTVLLVDKTAIIAECRGAGSIYRLGYNAVHGWNCSCPAKGRCAHLVALQNVTVQPPGRPASSAYPEVGMNAFVPGSGRATYSSVKTLEPREW
jgi:hypothetical protein